MLNHFVHTDDVYYYSCSQCGEQSLGAGTPENAHALAEQFGKFSADDWTCQDCYSAQVHSDLNSLRQSFLTALPQHIPIDPPIPFWNQPDRTVKCQRCEKNFITRARNAIYCKHCRPLVKRQKNAARQVSAR